MHEITGDFTAEVGRIAIVAGRFNSFIVEQLVKGAEDTLVRHGVKTEDIDLVWAPGAFEIPLATKRLLAADKYSAVIALGAVIRGATPHFDFVAGDCSKGLASLTLEFSAPVAFGVLTTDTVEQAVERAGTKAGNKGADAAICALEMISVLGKI